MTNQQIASAIAKTEKMTAIVNLGEFSTKITEMDELATATEYFDEIGINYDIDYVRETNQCELQNEFIRQEKN